METHTRRISVMIREDQHEKLATTNVNVSGLIRDLIDDHLSEHKITIAVSEETRSLYNQIVSKTGSTDAEIEPYLKVALKAMLKDKIKAMEKLHQSLEKK